MFTVPMHIVRHDPDMSDLLLLCVIEGLCHLLSALFAQELPMHIARVMQSLNKIKQEPCGLDASQRLQDEQLIQEQLTRLLSLGADSCLERNKILPGKFPGMKLFTVDVFFSHALCKARPNMSDLIALCMIEGLCHLLSTLFAQDLTNGTARVLQSLIKKEQTPCEEPCEGHEEGAEEEEPEEDEEIQEETEEEPEEEDTGDETENSEEGPGRENKRPRLADGPRLVRGRWRPAVMLRYLVDRQGLDYWGHHISAGILRRHHPVPRADLFGDSTDVAWHVSPVKREYLQDRRTTILNEQGVVLTIFDQLASPYALPASIKQKRWWGFTDFRLSRPEDLQQVEEIEAVDFSRPVETFNS